MRDSQNGRTLGAALLIVQGAVTALFPQVGVTFAKKMIGKNFDNVSELEAKPAYLRQLRALGVGTIAAVGTGLLLQSRAETDDGPTGAGEFGDGDGTGTDRDDE
jgi:hypothetical protein